MELNNIIKYSFFLIVCSMFSCDIELPEQVESEYKKLSEKIDFNKDVKPILSDKCFLCHGPDEGTRKAGMRFDTEFGLYEKNLKGNFPVKPGSLKKSEVINRVLSDDPSYIMPPPDSHLLLNASEKAILVKWVEQGAKWKKHWAFISPINHEIPRVENDELVVNEIDNFVLSKLEKENLKFSKQADREILLRRITFDLIGLPPTIDELDAFLLDTSTNAYEKQVDRLLASPHYGEQRTLDWMDLSRFADTHGYSVDRYRDMSPWRDWVIQAFNKNMSYDQFVTWQLAGDLMENPTREMKLATAFNRIHPQNMEGGIIPEEFLVEYAVDRTSTFGQAFMALSLACARCHDHKYDPISQKNFYELTSYFNNINEAGQISYNNAMPVPTLLLMSEEEDEMMTYMEDLMQDLESEIDSVEKFAFNSDFKKWILNGDYKRDIQSKPRRHQTAYFNLDNGKLINAMAPYQKGTMKRESQENQKIDLVKGYKHDGIRFDGDTWLDLKKTAIFDRSDSFTINFWANIPRELKNGNIAHKGSGAILFAWRGYHLKIVDDRLEIMMCHTAPDNAITEISKEGFPRDEWVNFSISYDGSSKANGFKLFVNGDEMETIVQVDNLYKDILFGIDEEPGLQFGARLRGKGIKDAIVDEIKVFDSELSNIEIMKLFNSDELNSLVGKNSDKLTAEDEKLLYQFYAKNILKNTKQQYKKLTKLRKSYADSVETIQEVMVMKETPTPIKSYFLNRGVYDARGEEVFPNTPEALFAMSDEYEKNRLGLAKWLFDKKHPLTARVAVNRYWQNYFGKGLVKTSDDFGNQGEMPSHPELLDWLAIQFVDSGWDVKALQKLIVMSYTYRQSSIASENLIKTDKENKLLARGPSKRLTGEMLRDNALASSGLLDKTIGGESVKPYQPEGLWIVNGARYKEDVGSKLYRRSMYTIWKRSVPNPSIATFDAPSRDICTIRRQETNTPLQALVLLNDPTYIEAARVLGYDMIFEENLNEAISKVFREITGRKIKSQELELLISLQKEEYKNFKDHKPKIDGWIKTGAYRIEKGQDEALIAANAVVASTIMNSDAAITKR
jgi:hypothetical protein